MPSLFRRIRQRFCPHTGKRIWDINRTPDGPYRLRLYCPRCGQKWDLLRDPDTLVDTTAANDEMRETMRRNLGLDDEAAPPV